MRSKIWGRFIKFGLLFVVMGALLTGIAFPAMAQTTATPQLHTVQGNVLSVNTSQSNFVIQNGTQSPVTITVDPNTRYFLVPMGKVDTYVNNQINKNLKQGKGKQTRAGALKQAHIPANWRSDLGWLETFDTQAQFSNIQTDDRVIARVDANNLAKQVLIIKAPVIQTIKGTVSQVNTNSLVITPANGTAVTLNIAANTRITLNGSLSVQINQFAVAVYNRNTLVAQTINIQAKAPAPTPAASLTAITVTHATVSGNLTVGNTLQFGATGTYANGSTANISSQVTWNSSNTNTATISNTGLATGAAAGTTNITASSNGITSQPVIITVGP